MAINTKAILRKGVTLEQIENALNEKYKEVETETTSFDNFFTVCFKDGKHYRTMYVSFRNSCEQENGIPGIWVSLGYWGKA